MPSWQAVRWCIVALACWTDVVLSSRHGPPAPAPASPPKPHLRLPPQDAPLEFVVAQVLGKGAGSGAPPVLTKRQFLNLAHVAEVAQVRERRGGAGSRA